MDKNTRKYGTSRQTAQKTGQKVKPSTTSKLKPSKHSAAPSNKIDCEPNPPSIPSNQQHTSSSSIGGQNPLVVSDDSKLVENKPIITSYVTSSQRLPPKKSNKKRPMSRNNFTNVKPRNINESLAFDNIEQIDEDDGVVLIITNKPSTISSNRSSIQPKNLVRRPTSTNIPKRTSSIPTNGRPRERSSASIIIPSTSKSSTNNVNFVHHPSEKINDSDGSRRGSRITPKQSRPNSSVNKSPVRNVKSNNARLSKNNPSMSPIITPKIDNVGNLLSVPSSTLIHNRDSYLKKNHISSIVTPKRLSVQSTNLIQNKDSYLKKSPPSSPIFTPKRDSVESSSSTLIQNRDSCLKIHPPSPLSKVAFTYSDINHDKSMSETLPQDLSNKTSSVNDDDLKRRKKLWNVIKELIETEKAFLQDMRLLEEVYFIQARDIPIFDQYDCKIIFSNLPDIIKFSDDFLDLLLTASGIEGSDNDLEKHYKLENDETFIGHVFAQMMKKEQGDSRLEKVYGEYCKRHEAAVQKLQEFDHDDNVQGFLQKCKSQCNGRTTCWDITSLLIKPVQRVLKYPLLLHQILSHTKPSHPDYEQIQFSLLEITKVAERINEIKKRKDIVEKIKRNDIKVTEDELYNAYVEKFKSLEQRGLQLEEDVKCWVRSIKSFFEDQRRLAAAIEEFHTLGISTNKNLDDFVRIIEYGKTIKGLESSCGKEMEEAIKKVLFPQIEKFLSLFKAPAAVMKKRERKLLDHCHVNSLKAKGETPEKSLQQSDDAFMSISEQLREELPTFFVFMMEYFDIIVQELVKIQARFYRQMSMDFQQYFCKFVDLQALEQISTDRELVLRDMDIVGEYTNYYHYMLEMDKELNNFVLIDTQRSDINDNKNERKSKSSESVRSSTSTSSRRLEGSLNKEDSKEHRKGGIWTDDDDAEGYSWYSSNSLDNKIRNLFEFDQTIEYESRQKYGAHKKYSTDSIIEHRSSYDNNTFHDSLIGEEKDEVIIFT
ncbi:23695_t:CDS:10 [Cetraspora pellucida]|uniref:23695_t:CDS:1 n=1 Tax=Cetraspora pellucida TaxID=1433469 RepID=A0A9N8YWH7_9GLOM|nr:23695_t:CDS:10 [Cetraspora pellucida]